MARIAYWFREGSEYIDIDLRALGSRHALTLTECRARWPYPCATWRRAGAVDLGWSWFASWHALVPALACRLRGRPFVLVVGGYDTASVPGIGYGHQRGGGKAWIARAGMALATHLVAISEFGREELLALGVNASKVRSIPLGLDPARYRSDALRTRGLTVT